MRVLVVQNFDGTGLGQLATALDEAAAAVELVRAHRGEHLPAAANGHDALVVLGGGQNALADADYPHIPALLELIRDFTTRDRSVLGICLGSQLLARAFGGRNEIGTAREMGWQAVTLSEHAAGDPVFRGLPASFPIFHWHDDTFSLPAGATRLASSTVTANQAFRLGRVAYGIQFHFEANRALVRRWNQEFADYIALNHPDWPGRHDEEAGLHGAAADAAGLAIARGWVSTI